MSRIRRLLTHVDRMPKAPFVVAVVVASLLAAVAWATAPEIETKVEEVEELSYPSESELPDTPPPPGEEFEVELLEYGFGSITLNGQDYLSIGAVVHNPHPELPVDVTFEVTAIAPGGNELVSERFGFRHAAPDADTLFGHLISGDAAQWEEYDPELSIVESRIFNGGEPLPLHLGDRFAVLDIEDMLVPEGKRIVYQVESDLDEKFHFQPDVVFRDSSGRIVGGVAGRDSPARSTDSSSSITVPPGTSVRHFYLESDEIPAGADLEQTEIGPGGVLAGG